MLEQEPTFSTQPQQIAKVAHAKAMYGLAKRYAGQHQGHAHFSGEGEGSYIHLT